MMNQISRSNVGTLDLNEERINKLFGVDYIKLDTQSIYEHLPIFQNKLGKIESMKSKVLNTEFGQPVDQGTTQEETKGGPQPLQMLVNYSDFDVKFGQFDTDILFSYTQNIKFMIEGGEELLYDEIKMITTLDVEAENDVVFVRVLNNKIDSRNNERKNLPVRNKMDMTTNEYREFLSTFGFTMNYMKKWLNEVIFRDGIKFPYKPDQLLTTLAFLEGSMHVMLRVDPNAAVFFEKEFWKSSEDFKKV